MTWMPGTKLEFLVRAIEPVAKGNHQAFITRGGGKPRAVITDVRSAELKQWESRLRTAASAELVHRGLPMLVGKPCEVQLVLWLVRPRGDFHPTKGHLLGTARAEPWSKPDIDKLQRTIFDALTKCVIDDDSRICRVVVEKRYVDDAARAGVAVRVIARAATIREANQCALSSSSAPTTAA
jgi:hypothetical protein